MKTKERARKQICDDILELLLIAYTYGCEDANEMLGTTIAPTYEEMRDSVYRKVAGKDFEQRVGQYILEFSDELEYAEEQKTSAPGEEPTIPKVPSPPVGDIMRIAETDTHRVYNEGSFGTAEIAQKTGAVKGKIMKTWCTQLDDRVREQHTYLEGTTIPLNAEFFTYDGDHGLAPGLLERPESVINCRCYLKFTAA